jgi:hypothetical protein
MITVPRALRPQRELYALRLRTKLRSATVSHAFRCVQEASGARDIIKEFIVVGSPREVV